MSRAEIITAVKALCVSRYGGDYRAGFDHYDQDHDGHIALDELEMLLADAGVGRSWTRGVIGRAVIAELDTDGDGVIEWDEFNTVLGEVSS